MRIGLVRRAVRDRLRGEAAIGMSHDPRSAGPVALGWWSANLGARWPLDYGEPCACRSNRSSALRESAVFEFDMKDNKGSRTKRLLEKLVEHLGAQSAAEDAVRKAVEQVVVIFDKLASRRRGSATVS
ncbi:hypothetical protein JMM61_04880 [Rhodovulum sulfidophilum]|uniref:hypothetical protein n=1 Tax=Rhodovulum sulfidophilum TaxID=35806 RepID=UPI001928A1E1|nr:hypothetical protein [Rhodovulum sulfidophilum]MBL3584711.1 hypothetical protein [Rhodovulum sulfidophilum]